MHLNRLFLPRLAAGLLLASVIALPVPAAAQMAFLGNSTPAPSGVLGSVAYNDKANVYLQVYEWNSSIWGRFIGANGAILGIPFRIGLHQQLYSLKPKVTYSSGNAVDRFLVTYVSDANLFNNGSNIFGQLVAYTGAGPAGGELVGGVIPISPNSHDGGRVQRTSDVIYNPLNSRFLVVYDELHGAPEGWEAMVRHFDSNGAAASGAVLASNVPFAQGAGVAAFDWQRNRYMVTFFGDAPNGASIGVFGRILDGNTLQDLSNLITVKAGFAIELAITYLPEADSFLPVWMEFTPGRDVVGRRVPSLFAGTMGNPYGVLATPTLNEGSPSLEYDWISRKVLVAAMREPVFIGGAILNAMGAPETAAFGMSTPIPANGSFYPTLRGAASGIFGVSYNTDYSFMQFERYQLPAAATPGPKCCGAVPVPQGVTVQVDTPGSNQTITPPFNIVGWAIDTRSTNGPGIDVLHAWAVPTNGGAATFVGVIAVGDYRPDVGQAYGAQFTQSGFGVTMANIPPGAYTLVLYPHSTVTGAFEYDKVKTLNINIVGGALTMIDTPVWGQTFGNGGVGMHISGWALDLANPSFDGVDTVHIWAINASTGATTFLGVPGPEIRLDVANIYGNRFWESGYRLVNATPLPPGTYYLIVYSHSYGAAGFNIGRVVGVHIQ
jgi:hypothetical protein